MKTTKLAKIVLITGLSGSGKTVALRALEDNSFYCIDNLPPSFIPAVSQQLNENGDLHIAIAVDARTGKDIHALPQIIDNLRQNAIDARVIFLDAQDHELVRRYSETRRRHPMSTRLSDNATVEECVQAERQALAAIRPLADLIDTSELLPTTLRRWVLQTVGEKAAKMTLIIETFAFKNSLPKDSDLVFDARCLSNPHYDKVLRPLTGKNPAVQEFIQQDERSHEFLDDIEIYLRKWLPRYKKEQRSYVTVAIGCTGGQHRSVYIAEALHERIKNKPVKTVENVLVRHRNGLTFFDHP